VSHHNVWFYNQLMYAIRKHVRGGSFSTFARKSLRKFDFRNS
jgi:queuine/archaeosine tRNA-ribosyltransferase